MKIIKTRLQGCVVIEPKIFRDQRGFFLETYNKSRYEQDANIKLSFVQDNHSRSSKGVLRGLHFQKTKPQGKLVRAIKGEVLDVAVDIRKQSSTFGQSESVILSSKNNKQFWIPPGFAHGFLVLSEDAEIEYKCTDFYDPMDEGCIIWNDPYLNISWPIKNPTLSEKDANAKKLNQLEL